MAKQIWIPEAQAAAKLNIAYPRTLRLRVTGKGRYAGKERLPIAFTQPGKSYLYSEIDIDKYLLKTSSR
jgi:hypothetical protein